MHQVFYDLKQALVLRELLAIGSLITFAAALLLWAAILKPEAF